MDNHQQLNGQGNTTNNLMARATPSTTKTQGQLQQQQQRSQWQPPPSPEEALFTTLFCAWCCFSLLFLGEWCCFLPLSMWVVLLSLFLWSGAGFPPPLLPFWVVLLSFSSSFFGAVQHVLLNWIPSLVVDRGKHHHPQGERNPSVKWHRALHDASWPEKGFIVRGREVGLTGTSATAISSGAALWGPVLQGFRVGEGSTAFG